MPSVHEYQKLEVDSRKPGMPHPDECPKLKIKGVLWAIPAKGTKVRPVFKDGKFSSEISANDWPEAQALLDSMPTREEKCCPTCGQIVRSDVDINPEAESDMDWLSSFYALAAKLLLEHYTLTNEQIAEMLAFDGSDTPVWTTQLTCWCGRGDTDVVTSVFVDESMLKDDVMLDEAEVGKRELEELLDIPV